MTIKSASKLAISTVTAVALTLSTSFVSAAPDVVVTQAWARATVAAQKTSGVFMQIAVSEDAVLIGASSPVAGEVQVHQTRQNDNIARMEHLKDGLPLMSGRTTELKPGGAHIMLMQLKQPLDDGQLIQLNLTVADKSGAESVVTLNVPVRPITTK